MNDNKFTFNLNAKQVFIIIVSIQLAMLGLITLDSLNLGFPILRQLVGFLYLTFVPGFLLLSIFRITNLGVLEIILYSIGLSLSFLMFIGFLMNSFYPIIGISRPISIIPLLFTLTVIVILLSIIFYKRNKKLIIKIPIIKGTLLIIILLFTLLPFVGIFGAYLLKYYNTNIPLLTLFALISIIPLLISININKIPVKILPFIIWIISVSLVLSHSLAFKCLSYTLSDASMEYYYASLVYQNGIWDPQISGNHNAMLRIVMLHPIYAIILNINLTNVFMIIHPLLYSFTPLALYVLFRKQTNEKTAFLSCFFFMSLHTFFLILSRMTRTGIAELFLALFALSIIDKNLDYLKKIILSAIFALSIVVSHYGTSYLLMFALITSILLFVLFKKFLDFPVMKEKMIILSISPLYIVFLIAWYMYTSNSSSLETLVKFLSYIINRLSAFSPETSYTLYALIRDWSFSVEISRNLIIIASLFITAGIVDLIWNIFKRKKIGYHPEFVILSLSFFGIFLSASLPIKEFNPARILHLSLVFLSPFLITGFLKICRIFGIHNKTYPIIAIFFIILFLFNTGFVSEVLTKGDDYSPNILISKPRALDIDDAQFIYSFYGMYLSEKDVSSTQWLVKLRENESKIYTDHPTIFYNFIAPLELYNEVIQITNKTYIKKGYIFLRTYNIFKNIVITQTYPPKIIKNANKFLPLNSSNRIYTNGGNEIYYR